MFSVSGRSEPSMLSILIVLCFPVQLVLRQIAGPDTMPCVLESDRSPETMYRLPGSGVFCFLSPGSVSVSLQSILILFCCRSSQLFSS